MDYQRHYDLLVERAKIRLLDGYTEKHHIIPKCIGGSNDFDNLIVLTPEEHYLAHQLLIKIYDEPKLVYAAKMMSIGSAKHKRNNKLYGWLKRKFIKINTERMKGHTWNKGQIPWNKGKKCPQISSSKKGIRTSLGMTGKNHSSVTKKKLRIINQKSYSLIDLMINKEYIFVSHKLKEFCELYDLNYIALLNAKNSTGVYRKKWKIREI